MLHVIAQTLNEQNAIITIKIQYFKHHLSKYNYFLFPSFFLTKKTMKQSLQQQKSNKITKKQT